MQVFCFIGKWKIPTELAKNDKKWNLSIFSDLWSKLSPKEYILHETVFCIKDKPSKCMENMLMNKLNLEREFPKDLQLSTLNFLGIF